MKYKNILFLLIAILTANISAQQRIEKMAKPGSNGIYVFLGYKLASESLSLDNIKTYHVERKSKSESNWETIADVSAPKSLEEFNSRIKKLAAFLPETSVIQQIPAKSLWDKLSKYKKVDSLKAWGNNLVVQTAIGIVYHDTTAEKNTVYEYRVSVVDFTNSTKPPLLSNYISYPQSFKNGRIKLISKNFSNGSVFLQFRSIKVSKPFTFQVFRQSFNKDGFKKIETVHSISSNKDTILFNVKDTLISGINVFRYYVLPTDSYGNTGIPSDTALVATYQFGSIDLPKNIKTKSLDSTGGIQLSWSVEQTPLIKSVGIYKSESWNDKGIKIADVSPFDTTYTDYLTEPMKMYFYQMDIVGLLGEVSPKTPKVFGVFKSSAKPLQPKIKYATGLKNGVQFEITSPDFQAKGYRVYRGYDKKPELLPITGLILRKDSITVFTDTSKELSGRYFYNYAVKAENSSRVLSNYSDTVSIRPLKKTEPPTPINLRTIILQGKVNLSWADMKPFDELLQGYFIYRREAKGKGKEAGQYSKLNDSLYSSTFYIDSTIQKSKTYEYAIQSVDCYNGISKYSASSVVKVESTKPLPPAGVLVEKVQDGIKITFDTPLESDGFSYKLYRSSTNEKEKLIATISKEPFEYIDKTAKKDTRYVYFLISVNKDGIESKKSASVAIR